MAGSDHLGAGMVPLPDEGRLFAGRARVRLGDATQDGRVRLDALARYLQDVAADDARDAELEDDRSWVVRRTTLRATRLPMLDDELDIVTFCGGYGGRWAERRTRLTGPGGAMVDAAALWVCLDATGRPVPVSDRFVAAYAGAAGGRKVSARLHHPDPDPAEPAETWSWALRASDLDVLGHVNNAATWEAIEEALARTGRPSWVAAELEYRQPLNPGERITVRCASYDDLEAQAADGLAGAGASAPAPTDGPAGARAATDSPAGAPAGECPGLAVWLLAGDEVRASARVVHR